MGHLDQAVSEYAAGALLRYFRHAVRVAVGGPRIDAQRDRDVLRGHWALSEPVRALADYLLSNRHETQTLLTTERRVDDVIARGAIDARATLVHRLRTGLATAIVANEPIRTFETGPNQVLAWVIHQASVFAARLLAWQAPGSLYGALAEAVMNQIAQIRRLDVLRDALKSSFIQRRPASDSLRDAARSRRTIYRLAVVAHNVLSGIESGDASAIRQVIASTLVGPLEVWRRFELAVAMAVGEALAAKTGQDLRLSILAGDPSAPLLTCGRYALFWQQTTSLYAPPALEPSELMVQSILSAYGFSAGGDRPDLLLVDQMAAKAIAVVEVKYVAADTAGVRFREAVDQIVRYGRGYETGAELRNLVSRSLVALSVDAPIPVAPATGVPSAVSFDSIERGELVAWVRRIIH